MSVSWFPRRLPAESGFDLRAKFADGLAPDSIRCELARGRIESGERCGVLRDDFFICAQVAVNPKSSLCPTDDREISLRRWFQEQHNLFSGTKARRARNRGRDISHPSAEQPHHDALGRPASPGFLDFEFRECPDFAALPFHRVRHASRANDQWRRARHFRDGHARKCGGARGRAHQQCGKQQEKLLMLHSFHHSTSSIPVTTARLLFGSVMKSVRTPGSVVLEICRSSSIVPGKRPVTIEAVTPISLPSGLPIGPLNAYVNVGSRPSPCTQMLTVSVPEAGGVTESGEPCTPQVVPPVR